LDTPRRPHEWLAGFVDVRWNPLTADFKVLYDATKAGLDTPEGRWVVVCEAHGSMAATTDQSLAYAMLNGPSWEFCGTCELVEFYGGPD
jgi:hypothetical protein